MVAGHLVAGHCAAPPPSLSPRSLSSSRWSRRAAAAPTADAAVQLDRRDPEMDQRLSPQAGSGRPARRRARAQRHAGVQGRRKHRAPISASSPACSAPIRSAPRYLVAKMLPIAPADHWVLVRAIAYSGLPNWKELLATFVDRMPTRRAMIDQYLDGKLPTLDQIDYQTAKPGMFDKIKVASSSTRTTRRRWRSSRARN